MQHETDITISDPGALPVNRNLMLSYFAMVALGVATFVVGMMLDRERTWYNFLIEYFFFLALGLSGYFFTALNYVAGATWSTPFKRIAEGMGSYLKFALLLAPVLLLGIPALYIWADPAHHHPFPMKHIYLCRWCYSLRLLIGFLIWIGLGGILVKNSLAQDKGAAGILSEKNKKIAVFFILLFALTWTFTSVDLLMSLEELWFSTIFPVYCFSGLFLSGLSLIALLAIAFRRAKYTGGLIHEIHIRDISTWIMAFSAFMVYIGFSQFMLIWYGNLPLEIFYISRRSVEGWQFVFILLPLLKWILPFVALMPQKLRANEKVIVFVALGVLLGQWIDIYWMVAPTFSKSLVLPNWIEIGMFLGFAGLFGIAITRFYNRHSLVAFNDPRIKEALSGRYLHV